MTGKNSKTLDQLWTTATPSPSPEEQRAGLVLLSALAEGEPVTVAQFAEALDWPVDEAEAVLKASPLSPFVYAGEDGRVVGFHGLSTARTHHRFSIRGRTLWAWCAQDSLLLPELLGEPAEVESRDPESGQPVRLNISPAGVEAVEPKDATVSWMGPDTVDLTSASRIIATGCHFVFFFASPTSGRRWLAEHPGMVLRSLDEAFAFGKRWNAHLFGAGLEQRRAGPA